MSPYVVAPSMRAYPLAERKQPGRNAAAQPAVDLYQSGVLILNQSLKPVAADTGAMQILAAAGVSNGEQALSIPEAVLENIKGRNRDDLSARTTHCLIGKRRYRCRSYIVSSATDTASGNLITVILEKDEGRPDPIAPIVAEYGLSVREQEALRGMALGFTTKELAFRMGISPNTVKAFVRLIMIKLGVTTRAAILGKILELDGRT